MRAKKSELEKQPLGVFEGVLILWRREDFESVAAWFHGAAMLQPWTKREFEKELSFLGEVAAMRHQIQRENERGVGK